MRFRLQRRRATIAARHVCCFRFDDDRSVREPRDTAIGVLAKCANDGTDTDHCGYYSADIRESHRPQPARRQRSCNRRWSGRIRASSDHDGVGWRRRDERWRER